MPYNLYYDVWAEGVAEQQGLRVDILSSKRPVSPDGEVDCFFYAGTLPQKLDASFAVDVLNEMVTLLNERIERDERMKAIPYFDQCEECGDWVSANRVGHPQRMTYDNEGNEIGLVERTVCVSCLNNPGWFRRLEDTKK